MFRMRESCGKLTASDPARALMGDVVAMKQQLDAVLGGVKQMHATIKQKAPFLSA